MAEAGANSANEPKRKNKNSKNRNSWMKKRKNNTWKNLENFK